MKAVIQGLLFGLLLVSCSKLDDADPNAFDSSLLAASAVYNGVLGTSNIEVFLDDNRLNATTERIPLGDMFAHVNVIPGERTLSSIFQFQQQTSEKQASPQQGSVKSDQSKVVFEAGKVYSLFLYGSGEANFKHKLVEDDVIKARPRHFKLRVANFRMDTGVTVNFKLSGGAINSAYEVPLEEVTGFVELPVADYAVKIEGLGGRYEEFIRDFTPKDQAVYTMWVWGSARIQQFPINNALEGPVTITKHGIQ